MISMRIEEYHRQVGISRARHPDWRSGQAHFNALCKLRPDLSEEVRGDLALDPFISDANIPAFLDWVMVHWALDPEPPHVTSL